MRWIFPVLLIFTSCHRDPSLWKISNLHNDHISIFGHGGMGDRNWLPIDSKQSLQQCLEGGSEGTEMDLRLSSDGQLVIFHDDEMNDLTECTGKLRDKTFSDIVGCRYTPVSVKGEHVSGADEFFSTVANKSKFVFTLECKIKLDDDSAYMDLFARRVAELVEKHGIANTAMIESYNIEFLLMLRRLSPGLKFFVYAPSADRGIELGKRYGLYGITMDRRLLTADDAAAIHEAGLRLTVFSMASKEETIETIGLSPDFIQTDNLEMAKELLNQ